MKSRFSTMKSSVPSARYVSKMARGSLAKTLQKSLDTATRTKLSSTTLMRKTSSCVEAGVTKWENSLAR